MPRGNSPLQPSRSGRQEGARRIKDDALKSARPTRAMAKDKQRTIGKVKQKEKQLASPKSLTLASPKKQSVPRAKEAASHASTSNPIAPERVRQIIAGLDRLYPNATCALTHRSA